MIDFATELLRRRSGEGMVTKPGVFNTGQMQTQQLGQGFNPTIPVTGQTIGQAMAPQQPPQPYYGGTPSRQMAQMPPTQPKPVASPHSQMFRYGFGR